MLLLQHVVNCSGIKKSSAVALKKLISILGMQYVALERNIFWLILFYFR